MGRGSSNRHKQKQIHQPAPVMQNALFTINDIENAYYNALIKKEQETDRRKEEKRLQLLQKIGRKDYTHLHPFKAWWCELGNMFVQLWKMRTLRKEDMYEHTFTQAFIKAILSTILRILNLMTQCIGALYVVIGFLQLLNWERWSIAQRLFPNIIHTAWLLDVAWILFGIMIGCFAMFMKFVRWEMEQSKDSNYLLSIVGIAVSIGLCFLFPT
ncbi:MAG: hypothetical protein IJZ68_05520 [Bacteroidaceae bacterium]|nr:hypothetical protein [Bacteroidaceae bacterium]